MSIVIISEEFSITAIFTAESGSTFCLSFLDYETYLSWRGYLDDRHTLKAEDIFSFKSSKRKFPTQNIEEFFNNVSWVVFAVDAALNSLLSGLSFMRARFKVSGEEITFNTYDYFKELAIDEGVSEDDFLYLDCLENPLDAKASFKEVMGVFTKLRGLSKKQLSAVKFLVEQRFILDIDTAISLLDKVVIVELCSYEWAENHWKELFFKDYDNSYHVPLLCADYVDYEEFGNNALERGIIAQSGDYLILNPKEFN